MEYGICLLPAVPLRREPNDRSEMLTQLLFGETARIFERNQKWLSVETDLDQYPGWIDAKQLEIVSESEYERILGSPVWLTQELLSPLEAVGQGKMAVPACSSLPGWQNGSFSIGERTFRYDGNVRRFSEGTGGQLIEDSLRFLHASYLWGGRTALGMDCSGFVQNVFRLNGINLPRDAHQQATLGKQVSFLSEAVPGDLAFFDNPEGAIVHVGILMDSQTIIHASGRVRIDTLDHHGIFNAEMKAYSHQLRLIRRMVE